MTTGTPTKGPLGVNFRSRLEARWAQFFTLLVWPWEYEPELGLDKWFPDFMLKSGPGMLVEVKPARTLSQLIPHRERVEKSGTVAQVWLVGAALAFTMDPEPKVGWLGWCGMSSLWTWEAVTLSDIAFESDLVPPSSFKRAQQLWIAAGNELQWHPKT